MSERPYITLKTPAKAELLVHKSRFIACAAPVSSQDQALQYLHEIKAFYPDATHHCYAYILGSNAGVMRYSDAGEPSGTAGIPILEALKMKGLANVCLAVVRYFGGTLLGTGGLARAYTKSSVQVLEAADLVMMTPSLRMLMNVPYPMWDILQRRIADMPVIVEYTVYGADVRVTLILRQSDAAQVSGNLIQCCEGRAHPEILQKDYYAWPFPGDKA